MLRSRKILHNHIQCKVQCLYMDNLSILSSSKPYNIYIYIKKHRLLPITFPYLTFPLAQFPLLQLYLHHSCIPPFKYPYKLLFVTSGTIIPYNKQVSNLVVQLDSILTIHISWFINTYTVFALYLTCCPFNCYHHFILLYINSLWLLQQSL